MKLRDPRVLAAAGWVGTAVVRLLSATLRFDYRSAGPVPVDPFQPPEREPFLYVLWHEHFLTPIARFGNPDVSALVSDHPDGRLLASLLRAKGVRPVHGSTGRGAVAAVRELLRSGSGHLAVTPDGPRGPRRVVQPGVVYLASRTGLRVVPIGVGHRRPWRLKSWDAFVVPRPFSRVRCLFGRPIFVPPGLRSDAFPAHARHIQGELDRVGDAAQLWADGGDAEPPPVPPARAAVVEQSRPVRRRGEGVRGESGG